MALKCYKCGRSPNEKAVFVLPRIRWGAAVRQGHGTGFSRMSVFFCEACRRRHRGSWKYARKPR